MNVVGSNLVLSLVVNAFRSCFGGLPEHFDNSLLDCSRWVTSDSEEERRTSWEAWRACRSDRVNAPSIRERLAARLTPTGEREYKAARISQLLTQTREGIELAPCGEVGVAAMGIVPKCFEKRIHRVIVHVYAFMTTYSL